MKQEDVKVGRTYCNRGKGTVQRTVVDIGRDCLRGPTKAYWIWSRVPYVLYRQAGTHRQQRLSSFAAWAGSEVSDGD